MTAATDLSIAADLASTVTVIDACGRAQVPVLLLSDPGMGKSSLVRGLASAEGLPCETVLGSIREPADIAGLPVVGEAGVVMSPPAWARRLVEAGAGYLFLDELTTCPPAVQAALLSVALDRTVGDLVLSGEVRVVAGANPPDRAADGWELSPPLANRFCHLAYDPSPQSWAEGMTAGGSAPPAAGALAADKLRRQASVAAVVGFLNVRPDLLHVFPRDAVATGGPWPSRRTWDMLARALAHVREDDTAAREALAVGLVGEGAGVEFLTWCRAADLPVPAEVIADPSIVDWAGRPDRTWAILTGVVGHCVALGTVEGWGKAWGPLLHAAEHGAADVAAAAARTLGKSRPAKAKVPARVGKVFGPIVAAAGLGDAA